MPKGKILIADDTETFRSILGEALEACGYDIIYAGDGLEALKMIREELPSLDLLILDLLMPKMLGFDVLNSIRKIKEGKDLPVMVITGLFKSMEDIRKARELGASGFIDKALPMEDIVFRVDNFLTPEEELTREKPLVPVDILVNYSIGEESFSAYTYTISSDGLFLRTTEPAPVDTELRLSFSIPEEGETIEAGGKVIYIVSPDDKEELLKSPQGMGIEFTDISPQNEGSLADWVEKVVEEKDIRK